MKDKTPTKKPAAKKLTKAEKLAVQKLADQKARKAARAKERRAEKKETITKGSGNVFVDLGVDKPKQLDADNFMAMAKRQNQQAIKSTAADVVRGDEYEADMTAYRYVKPPLGWQFSDGMDEKYLKDGETCSIKPKPILPPIKKPSILARILNFLTGRKHG